MNLCSDLTKSSNSNHVEPKWLQRFDSVPRTRDQIRNEIHRSIDQTGNRFADPKRIYGREQREREGYLKVNCTAELEHGFDYCGEERRGINKG